MQLVYVSFIATIFILFAGTFFTSLQNNSPNIDLLSGSIALCSGKVSNGRCTGSVYCRACKNCKYCAHCNSGGSCGVCGKRSTKTYSSPKSEPPKKYNSNKTKSNYKNPSYSRSSKVAKPYNDKKRTPITPNNAYVITQKTSLREYGDSQAKVLKRLRVDEEVLVIESTGKYWWKVIHENEIGWVKKHLLKKKREIIYP